MIKKIDEECVFLIVSNLNTYLGAGLSLIKSLELVENSTKNSRYKKSLNRISKNINKGQLLSEALYKEKELYPCFLSDMIRIGEESGSLEKVLKKLSYHFKRNNQIKKSVTKALMYPCFLATSILSVILVYLFFVIPNFGELFQSIERSSSNFTMVILKYVNFIKNNVYANTIIFIYIIITILIIILIIRILKDKKLIMKLYFVKKYYESNLIFILQLIISSGIPIVSSVYVISENMSSGYLKEKINNMKDKLWSGESLSASIEDIEVISSISKNFIFSGEESGKLEENIEILAFILEKQLDDSINLMISIIEPAMIIFLGALVLMMILLVFIPIQEYMKYV